MGKRKKKLRPGMRVLVPDGPDMAEADVLEVWGDPPQYVRVALHRSHDPEDTVKVLLTPDLITVPEPA